MLQAVLALLEARVLQAVLALLGWLEQLELTVVTRLTQHLSEPLGEKARLVFRGFKVSQEHQERLVHLGPGALVAHLELLVIQQ